MLYSLRIFSHFPRYPPANWALLVLVPGWTYVHSRTPWVSPTDSLVRLGVSPTAASTPTGVFSQWSEALFPRAGTLSCGVCHPVQQLPSHGSFLPQLPVSPPPTGLNECFFFISFVVRLPYSSVFCKFWLFYVLKFLLSFFWLLEEAQCVYLRLHLGRKLLL